MASWLWRTARKQAKQGADTDGDDGTTVLVTLERVPSKQDVFPAGEGRPSRKRTSTKEELPEDEGPSLKRSNSKDDVIRADAPSEKASVRSAKKKSFVVPKLAGLEQAVANLTVLDEAILVAERSHCAEGLHFLRELSRMEASRTPKQRRNLASKLQARFFKDKSPEELFLPTALKARLAKGRMQPDDLLEARRHVLNDIRFNDRVLEALLPMLLRTPA